MDKYEYNITNLITRYPSLKECQKSIEQAYQILRDCFASNHKLLVAGNGGSCADAEHIVGELMKGFKNERKIDNELANKIKAIDCNVGESLTNNLQQGLPAIALNNHQGLNTAIINDVPNGGELTYAQQILGYGNEGDVFLGISSSGNAKNIYNACVIAKAKGLKIIGLTGKDGGMLAKISDASIIVPSDETFMIQELHLPIYHTLCLMLENYFYTK